MKLSHIYIYQIEGVGMVKIGKGYDPMYRLMSYSHEHYIPGMVNSLLAWELPKEDADRVERVIHRAVKNRQVSFGKTREIFKIEYDKAVELINKIIGKSPIKVKEDKPQKVLFFEHEGVKYYETFETPKSHVVSYAEFSSNWKPLSLFQRLRIILGKKLT